jgi:hypothetical protein
MDMDNNHELPLGLGEIVADRLISGAPPKSPAG